MLFPNLRRELILSALDSCWALLPIALTSLPLIWLKSLDFHGHGIEFLQQLISAFHLV